MSELVSHVGRYVKLKDKPFLARFEPKNDELLSSWLVRISKAHLSTPVSFVNIYLFGNEKQDFWERDIDMSISDEILFALSVKSGVPYHALQTATLKSYEKYLFEKAVANSTTSFVQPLGNYARIKRSKGLRFCPKCLLEDNEPYFRKEWRLSIITACQKHNCLLLNSCPSCGSSLSIFLTHDNKDMTHCYKCGYDLKKSAVEDVTNYQYGLIAQKGIMQILHSGSVEIDGYGRVYSIFYFIALRRLFSIMMWKGSPSKFKAELGIQDEWISPKIGRTLFWQVDIKTQHLFFSIAHWILKDPLVRINTLCDELKLSKTTLIQDMPYVPFFLKQIADSRPEKYIMMSSQEIRSVFQIILNRSLSITKRSFFVIAGWIWDYRKRPAIEGEWAVFQATGSLS